MICICIRPANYRVENNASEKAANKTSNLGREHEKALDAGVFGVRRPSEVIATQAGTVEHVRDAVTPQHFEVVGVALAADEHVVEKLDRMQLRAEQHRAAAAAFGRRTVRLLEDLLHPAQVELVVGDYRRLRRLATVGSRHHDDDVTAVTWLSWRSTSTALADYKQHPVACKPHRLAVTDRHR